MRRKHRDLTFNPILQLCCLRGIGFLKSNLYLPAATDGEAHLATPPAAPSEEKCVSNDGLHVCDAGHHVPWMVAGLA
jgi:hypothetical protein